MEHKKTQGTSLLEMVIALSLFSFVLLTSYAYSLRSIQITRSALDNSRQIIKPYKGFTLTELLVVTALSVLVCAAALQAFSMIKQTQMTQNALARLQENGRMIGILLGEAVRTAGNVGCNAFREDIPFRVQEGINAKDYGLIAGQRLLGVSYPQLRLNPLVKKEVLARLIPHSDILWIKTLTDRYTLAKNHSKEANELVINGNPHWQMRDHAVIALSDCAQVDFLPLQGNSKALYGRGQSRIPVSFNSPGDNYYQKNSQVGILSSTLFYIGKTEQGNAQNKPVLALYASDINAPHAYQLVEGVELLELQYGIGEKNQIIYYARDKVLDWGKVRRVRANVLLNSVDDALAYPKPYNVGNITVYPEDRLMRMWWQYEWPIKSFSIGNAFIIVLIFSVVIMVLVNSMLESSILQWKMSNNFKEGIDIRQKSEKQLEQYEQLLENTFLKTFPTAIRFLQFVPDTLHYNENRGVNYYHIQTDIIASTIAVRAVGENAPSNTPSWYEAWKKSLPEDAIVRNLQPVLLKEKCVIFVQVIFDNGTKTVLSVHEKDTGILIKDFLFSSTIELTLIDSRQRGFADSCIIAHHNGNIEKWDIQDADPYRWKIMHNGQDYQHNEKILAPVMVGPSLEGKGWFYYVLSENAEGNRSLHVLWDKGENASIKTQCMIYGDDTMGKPLLRQGLLIVPINKKVIVYDAYSGELIQEKSFGDFSNNKNNLLLEVNVADKKPREKSRIIEIVSAEGIATVEMDIDYAQLGRRTWYE